VTTKYLKVSKKPNGRVFTLDETAALLRISRGSAYAAARSGQIPTIRIGRRLLVPTEALERMLAGNAAA
jgi:excisionase family DNA binding protein